MVLRLIRDLPGERPFLPPLPAEISADVAPGSRRQDHTTSPSAADVSSGEDHLTPQRPSQPAPRSVTIARTSLMLARAGRMGATDLLDGATANSDYLFTTSLNRNWRVARRSAIVGVAGP